MSQEDEVRMPLAPKSPDAAGWRLDEFLWALERNDDEWWALSDLQRRDLFLEAAHRWRRLDQAIGRWVDPSPAEADAPVAEQRAELVGGIGALHRRLKDRG